MDEAQLRQIFTQYYAVFDADRSQLAAYYNDQSQLSFEGNSVVGQANIVEKLVNLPFTKIHHAITTLDFQMTGTDAMLVLINGQLKADDDPPLPFSQCFVLRESAPGALTIANDMFRLGVHNF